MLSRDELIILISEFLEDNFAQDLRKDDFRQILCEENSGVLFQDLLARKGYMKSRRLPFASMKALRTLYYIFFKKELGIDLINEPGVFRQLHYETARGGYYHSVDFTMSPAAQILLGNEEFEITVPADVDQVEIIAYATDISPKDIVQAPSSAKLKIKFSKHLESPETHVYCAPEDLRERLNIEVE